MRIASMRCAACGERPVSERLLNRNVFDISAGRRRQCVCVCPCEFKHYSVPADGSHSNAGTWARKILLMCVCVRVRKMGAIFLSVG